MAVTLSIWELSRWNRHWNLINSSVSKIAWCRIWRLYWMVAKLEVYLKLSLDGDGIDNVTLRLWKFSDFCSRHTVGVAGDDIMFHILVLYDFNVYEPYLKTWCSKQMTFMERVNLIASRWLWRLGKALVIREGIERQLLKTYTKETSSMYHLAIETAEQSNYGRSAIVTFRHRHLTRWSLVDFEDIWNYFETNSSDLWLKYLL